MPSAENEVAVEAEVALRALLREVANKSRLKLQAGAEAVPVPAPAVELMVEILRHLANGNQVAVMARENELTTQEAANLLNVSRPYLVALLEAGKLPHRKVNKHRRVRVADLLAYKQRRDGEAKVALDELTREAQELGLGY